MRGSDFINASANVRALEKKLISQSAFIRASEASGISEALRVLSQQSDYNFTAITRYDDCEKLLKAELARVYAMLYKLSPHAAVVDIPAAKYDFHNLKTAIKAKYFRQRAQPPFIAASRCSPERIAAEANKPSSYERKSGLPPHLFRAAAAAEKAFAVSGNPQSIDITLDKLMLARMLELCDEVGSDMITRHVRCSVDFYNAKTLLRAKAMQKGTACLKEYLAPGGLCEPGFFVSCYGKSPAATASAFYYKSFGDTAKKGFEAYEKFGSYAAFERLLDNLLIEQTRAAKYIAYGPEVLYAYLLSKENEMRQIRILVAGRQNGLPLGELRERLRECYA